MNTTTRQLNILQLRSTQSTITTTTINQQTQTTIKK